MILAQSVTETPEVLVEVLPGGASLLVELPPLLGPLVGAALLLFLFRFIAALGHELHSRALALLCP